jgi:hypothetical protein
MKYLFVDLQPVSVNRRRRLDRRSQGIDENEMKSGVVSQQYGLVELSRGESILSER